MPSQESNSKSHTPLSYHYSLRLLQPPSPSTTTFSRKSIPQTTTTLSLDYSFITDRATPTSPHPPIATVSARIAKHLRWIANHYASLHTFKLILVTNGCCDECSEESIEAHFGFVRPGAEMDIAQIYLARLPLRDCYSVVVFKEKEEEEEEEDEEMCLKRLMQPVEVQREGSAYGHKMLSTLQMESQPELAPAVRWPVVMAWHHWCR